MKSKVGFRPDGSDSTREMDADKQRISSSLHFAGRLSHSKSPTPGKIVTGVSVGKNSQKVDFEIDLEPQVMFRQEVPPAASPVSSELPQYGFMLIGEDFSEEPEKAWVQWDKLILEPKIDDVRMQMIFHQGKVRLQTRGTSVRNPKVFLEKTVNFPQFHGLYKPEFEGMILDGGVFIGPRVTTKDNLWMGNNLPLITSIVNSGPENAATLQKYWGPARFVIYDIPVIKGIPNLEPLEKRIEMVKNFARLLNLDRLWQQTVPSLGRAMTWWKNSFEWITSTGGEGVVMKVKGSRYIPQRAKEWIRIKAFDDFELVLSGKASPGAGKFKGLVGSVELFDPISKSMAGFASGFDDEMRRRLTRPGSHGSEIVPEFVGRPVLVRANGKIKTGLRHPRIIKISESNDDGFRLR